MYLYEAYKIWNKKLFVLKYSQVELVEVKITQQSDINISFVLQRGNWENYLQPKLVINFMYERTSLTTQNADI